MADTTKDNAAFLLEGTDTRGRAVKRWLDGPPTFNDTKNMAVVNITALRPILLRRKTSN